MASAGLAAPAPQQLVQVHNAAPSFVRTVPAGLSHALHTINNPTVVRTVAQPQVHFVQQAQPATVVRTAVNAPVQHVIHEAPAIVRTVPVTATIEQVEEEVEVEASPNYSFGYSVADVRSGDAKTREETRDGDQVTGSYTVADPDGRLRRVVYTADKEHGFQATVTYDGEDGPPAIPIETQPALISTTVAADDVVVAEVSDNNEDSAAEEEDTTTEEDSATIVRTAQAAAAPTTIFRTFAPGASVVRTAPVAHQVVRASAAGDVHAFHNVHTAPAQHTLVHNVAHTPVVSGQFIQSPQFVRVAGSGLQQANTVATSSPFGFVRAFPSTFSTAGTTLIQA